MRKKQRFSTNTKQPIRDLVGFFASYLKSDSAKHALTRQPKFVEKKGKNTRGQFIEWKEIVGHNELAIAFAEAFRV